jgi:hypothetical protein
VLGVENYLLTEKSKVGSILVAWLRGLNGDGDITFKWLKLVWLKRLGLG